jgi:drug/metabolite transporter (DMT)-like permease
MRAHLTLLAVVAIWAGSFSVIKVLLDDDVTASDIAIIRYAIAAPGFAFILWRARGLPGLTRHDAVRVVGAGLLIVVGYHVSLNVGTRYTTAGIDALVVALAPGMTLMLAVALGLDRLRLRHVLGLAVAFVGTAVAVAFGSGGDLSSSSAKGPLIVVGAPLSFALTTSSCRSSADTTCSLTAATSLVGIIGLAPLVRGSTIETVSTASAVDVTLLGYLGLLATLLGYILWNVGLRAIGPTRSVAYTYAISPLAVVIGAVTLGETVTPWLFVGIALVIGGIAAAQGLSLRHGGKLKRLAGPVLARASR